MADTLHETHRWGERAYNGTRIPFCLDCRVDGFEDEPAAFEECPGKKITRKQGSECPATLESLDDPGHLHQCIGGHTTGHHFCGECQRWFGLKEDIL